METNQTYDFYVQTDICSPGTPQQSNVAFATTPDIQAPVLTINPGPGFEEVTYSFAGVPGSDGTYLVYGRPQGATNYGDPIGYLVGPNDTKTVTTNAWGILAYMDTFQTYEFYVETWSGSRHRTSNVVSATTRDIEAPKLKISQERVNNSNYAILTWDAVNGGTSYYVDVFSTAQGQWNQIARVDPAGNQTEFTYRDLQLLSGQINYYRVRVNRLSRYRPSNGVATVINYDYPDQNFGGTMCNISKGQPVNLSTGNMYLNETDYHLPGGVESIDLTRTYNSATTFSGLFGDGWSSVFDENVILMDNYTLRYMMSDGRAVYFKRAGLTEPFVPVTPGFYGQVIKNTDSTFTLTLKDGHSKKFSPGGKLLWMQDRNGNQTTLNYDGNGILTGITDAFGRTLTVTVINGRITQINDSINATTYDYYNGTNRLQTVTYADGSKYQFEYHATNNKLITVKDALNNILEKHDYDATTGWATTSEKQGGVEKYTFDYTHTNDQTNPYTTVTDANLKVSKYYFDKSRGRNVVTKVEGLCGCGGSGSEVTTYEYDTQLNLTRKVEGFGTINRETTYTYNDNGDRLSQTDIWGTQLFTYNQRGQLLTYKDRIDSQNTTSPVNTIENTYDTNSGNLLTTKDALGNITTINYPTTNNKGLPTSIVDARQSETKFVWNAQSLPQEIEDPYHKKTGYTYDARGRIKTVTNALTEVTTYNYFDDTQRKIEMIYPNADKVTYKYDIRKLLESITDERGKITTYTFDNAGRLITITDPLTHTREFGYDLMSNVISETDGLNNQTTYTYDDFNRLKEIQYPLAEFGDPTIRKEKFEYDKLGRILKHYDMADRQTVYGYDDINRTNTVTNPDGEVTTTAYNVRMQRIQVKDAKNQVYDFTYDALGQMLTQSRAGGTMSFIYDEAGNRTKRTDYMGRETTYEYDKLNRLKKINYVGILDPQGGANPTPIQTATYNYDDLSRLTSAANDAGTVTFAYDNRSRITSTTDVFGHTLNYEYELSSTVNQKRLKFDGAMYAKYNYDDANRLANILNSSDNTTISFGYDAANRLTSRNYPNGITTTYDYDNLNRIKGIVDDTSAAGYLVYRSYNYNLAGQISSMNDSVSGLTRTPTYDNADRLTSVTGSSPSLPSENYTYDDVGNRTASQRSASYTYQTGQFNRITSTATANYNYDGNGNMVTKVEGSNFWRFTWDYENRLTMASTRRQTVRYRYDALGRRVQRYFVGSKENTRFIYDGNDVLVDDNFGTLTKYLNGEGIDNKLRMQTGTDVKYFLSDHLGSTNALADTSGNLTATNSYDAFGNATNANFPSRYQYTGREFDNFTGLNFYRARWYDSNLGRFISEDPIGFEGGDVNLYGYVKNNPVMFTDPSGKVIPVLAMVTTGIIGGLVGGGAVIVIKGIGNLVNNKNFFHCADSKGYWIDVGIGAAGGAAVGATLPLLALVEAGAYSVAAVNAVGNGLQYGASVYLGRTQYSHMGLIYNLASGFVGGKIGGSLNYQKPFSSILTKDLADRSLIDKGNQLVGLTSAAAASVGGSSLLKGIGGSLFGGSSGILDACECENSYF